MLQNSQSKLLMTALVAAQAASALEIAESTALMESNGDHVKTFLAQIQDDDADAVDGPPSNSNTNTTEEEEAANTDKAPQDDSSAIDEKIDILSQAALDGLTAKKEWILEKLNFYAKEKLEQMKALDEQCRAGVLEEKKRGSEILDAAKANAFDNLKECRKDYVEALLEKKEELKEKLQDQLSKTINNIKELKVEGLLNEAGLPTEEHKAKLDQKIAQELEDFKTNSDEIVTVDYKECVYDSDGLKELFEACLSDVTSEFRDAFSGDTEEN
jgi:hypothetical protein